MSANDVDATREEVIESIERSAEVYGLSRSAGRVYAILYFAETPLSIPELVEETGYAKSTISNATRKLTRIGLIQRRSSTGGGRRVEFEPETDLWFVIQDVLQQYVQREMTSTQRTLDRARSQLDERDDRTAEPELTRIEDLQTTYTKLQTLLELVTEYSTDELIEALQRYESE